MSDRYRRPVATVLVVLLALGPPTLIGVFGLVAERERAQERRDAYAAYSSYAEHQQYCTRDGVLPGSQMTTCIIERARAQYEHEQAQADLHAQQAVAVWTTGVFALGWVGYLVSLIGIWFLFQNLQMLRGQIKQESDASAAQAVQFQAQLTRMEEANETARETGRAQARAYLSVEAFHLKFLKTGIELQVHLMNTGQSPAQNIRCGFASAEFWFKTETGVERLSCTLGRNMLTAGPDIQASKPGIARCNFGITMGAELVERFTERAARYRYNVAADLIILWEDVFKEPFEIPLRGQKEIRNVTGEVRLDLLGGPVASAKAFILKNCDDRTQWGGVGLNIPPPMPPSPLAPLPSEPEPEPDQRA